MEKNDCLRFSKEVFDNLITLLTETEKEVLMGVKRSDFKGFEMYKHKASIFTLDEAENLISNDILDLDDYTWDNMVCDNSVFNLVTFMKWCQYPKEYQVVKYYDFLKNKLIRCGEIVDGEEGNYVWNEVFNNLDDSECDYEKYHFEEYGIILNHPTYEWLEANGWDKEVFNLFPSGYKVMLNGEVVSITNMECTAIANGMELITTLYNKVKEEDGLASAYICASKNLIDKQKTCFNGDKIEVKLD